MAMKDIFVSPTEFFYDLVSEAISQRDMDTNPLAVKYLSELLLFYMNADNLFSEQDDSGKRRQSTLAEMYLKAINAEESHIKNDLLKRLGDTSLYISGFFASSLKKKVIDIDYYIDMGGTAFANLAYSIDNHLYQELYGEFAENFIDFVDVITWVSQNSLNSNEDLLRLYETYQITGSNLAKEKLIKHGFSLIDEEEKKAQ